MFIPRLKSPSLSGGYARNKYESSHPELWNGLRVGYCPQIAGVNEKILPDLVGHRHATWGTGTLVRKVVPTPVGPMVGIGHTATTDTGFQVPINYSVQGTTSQFACLYTFAHLANNTTVGLSNWGSLFLNRKQSTGAGPWRVIWDTSATSWDNSSSNLPGPVVYMSLCFQIDTGFNGEQWVNGTRVAAVTEGSGTATPWTTMSFFGQGGSVSQLALLATEGVGLCALLYNRMLTSSEINHLHNDPLAPFRLKPFVFHQAPAGGVTIPAVDEGMLVGGLQPLGGGLE